MVVYTALIYVVVGTTPADSLHGTLTPMAAASRDILGGGGEAIIAVTALLALTSMANAGVLSSSRYPFAMARGELAPPLFRRVHPRFGTPLASIALTGAALLVLIALGGAVTDATKAVVAAPRPDWIHPTGQSLSLFAGDLRSRDSETPTELEDDYGFPSGPVSAPTVFVGGAAE